MKFRRLFAPALLLSMAVPAYSPLSARADEVTPDPFAGLWDVTVQPNEATQLAGETPFKDRMLFDEGKLTLEACSQLGFAPTAYTVATADGVTKVVVEMTSDTQGDITWTTRVTGAGLVGTVQWEKPGGNTRVTPSPAVRIESLGYWTRRRRIDPQGLAIFDQSSLHAHWTPRQHATRDPGRPVFLEKPLFW